MRDRPSTSKPEQSWTLFDWVMVFGCIAVAVVVLIVATSCGLPGPGPIQPPKPPPVVPISQCPDVFPEGYTRPVPTNHSIIILPTTADERVILWLDRNCRFYYRGAIDYRYPGTQFCEFRPDLGDRYYAEDDNFVAPIPPPCTGQNVQESPWSAL